MKKSFNALVVAPILTLTMLFGFANDAEAQTLRRGPEFHITVKDKAGRTERIGIDCNQVRPVRMRDGSVRLAPNYYFFEPFDLDDSFILSGDPNNPQTLRKMDEHLKTVHYAPAAYLEYRQEASEGCEAYFPEFDNE